ncbi:MAG TPA: carboxypeptidase-like regulatory domain-containing protein [Prolixibacteraceae bacterium]|nr:carboxypeptidase-like regulatory domain-containing protein [Prolixibacteraceae bacterium]
MKTVFFAVILLGLSSFAFAEKTDSKTETKAESLVLSVSGNVIDEASGEALVGVEVKVEGSDVKTYTDFDGHFVINNLKSGDCKLVASYTSYNKTEKTLKIDPSNPKIKIELQASK